MSEVVDAVVAEVERLAAEYPDAVYASDGDYVFTHPDGSLDSVACSYTQGAVENGPETEGCLIGQAIARVLPGTDFTDLEGETPRQFYNLLGTAAGDPRLDWLGKVQAGQDCGRTWSEAVEMVGDIG